MSTSKYMIVGGRIDEIPHAFELPADVVCLDLEDTVPAAAKQATRDAVKDFVALGMRKGRMTAVRLSPLTTFDGIRDLLLMQQLDRAPCMIVLAKTESARDVAVVRELLRPLHGDLHYQPIIETGLALGEVERIAAAPGVGSISLGGKDLSEALRVQRSWEPLLYARSRCAAAAAMNGIPVVDGPQSRDESPEDVRALCLRLKALGFAGKSSICAEHLAVIHEVWPARRH